MITIHLSLIVILIFILCRWTAALQCKYEEEVRVSGNHLPSYLSLVKSSTKLSLRSSLTVQVKWRFQRAYRSKFEFVPSTFWFVLKIFVCSVPPAIGFKFIVSKLYTYVHTNVKTVFHHDSESLFFLYFNLSYFTHLTYKDTQSCILHLRKYVRLSVFLCETEDKAQFAVFLYFKLSLVTQSHI